jgi:hypothetical protein
VTDKLLSPQEKAAQTELDAVAKAKADAVSGEGTDIARRNAQQTLEGITAANAEAERVEQESAARKAKLEEAATKLDALIEQRSKAYADTDLKGFWVTKSGPAKFAAALGAAVGGYLAGKTGGRNMALDTIQQAVENDYQIQKDNLAQRRDLLMLSKQDRQAYEERLKNEDAKLRINKLGVYEKAARIQEEKLAKNGVADVDFNKDQTLLGLREIIAKQKQGLGAELYQRAVEQQKIGLEQQRINLERERMKAAQTPTGPTGVIMGPGGQPIGVAAGGEKQAVETSSAIAGYANFRKFAEDYRNMVQKHGSEFTGKTAGDMDALKTELLLAVRDSNTGLGALDKGLVSTVEGLVPDMTGFSGSFSNNARAIAKLNKAIQLADDKMRAKLDAAGVDGMRMLPAIRRAAAGGGGGR